MNDNDANLTSLLISKHFGLEQSEITHKLYKDNFNELLQNIERVVSYLLEKDMSRLLTGLYIVDVDEEQFKEIIAKSSPNDVSLNIAKLILQRELKKVEYRKKYSS